MGPGPEFEGKRLEMVTRALPRARRIAVLHAAWDGVYGEALRNAAARLGLTLLHAPSRPNDYAEAAALISRERPHAIYIGSGAYFAANRRRIIEIAMDNRLPLIGDGPLFVEVGALMSYSGDRTEFWDRTGNYVDRLLKGARPSDLPIEVMTKYELIFNMKTAKALGITIPPAVLLQADRKFE
jgi:putative ABC transport system substrate-binding protein